MPSSLEIHGWMTEAELTWLGQRAKSHNRIAEIGCWQGRSTVTLATNTEGIVFAVDNWLGAEKVVTPADRHLRALVFSYGGQQGLWSRFRDNIREFGAKVIPIYGTSPQISKVFISPIFDMVFIDAAHDEDSVRQDIQAWLPLITDGGLLCGHDYGVEGVAPAVDSLVPERQLVEGTSIWFDSVVHGTS